MPTSKSSRIRVGITIGDPAGIGPFTTLKAIERLWKVAHFVVIGSRSVLEKVSSFKKISQKIKILDLDNVDVKNFIPGTIRAEYGRASIEYLEAGLELIKKGEIDCLVTSPISKEAVHLAGFSYLGHTDYFLKKMNKKEEEIVMMLLNKYLRFSLVTTHIGLKKVSAHLSIHKICRVSLITYNFLKFNLGLAKARLGVCALNPHASDNGLFGKEENEIIKPAVKKLAKKIIIEGPLSADVAITRAFKKEFDAVIAMYHDQALIPLKLTGFSTGVNITLGLGFIRTSPLHGTAFDLVKEGKGNSADCSSTISAINLAICAATRKKD